MIDTGDLSLVIGTIALTVTVITLPVATYAIGRFGRGRHL